MTFERYKPTNIHRLIANIEGEEKSGKTDLALSAPEPIYFLAIDPNYEAAMRRFEDREIYVKEFYLDRDSASEQNPVTKRWDPWDAVWQDFNSTFREMVQLAGTGTVVIDTATEMYELARRAHLGKLAQVPPQLYQFCYQDLNALISYVKTYPCNLILTEKRFDKFGSPGEKETSQYKNFPYLCNINIRTLYEDGEFKIEVLNCGLNPHMNERKWPREVGGVKVMGFQNLIDEAWK